MVRKVGNTIAKRVPVSIVRKRYWKPHTSIRLKLGLTQEEIDNLTRPGACECCGSKERLCIDHCHDTKNT